ncbi:DUF4158 domain-containing protein [Klebsiella pneumoniae]|uniref:DUF4158 domain-containing protein n=1 Tax=Klebsiella pneumoniae TaxID=573 RepID=UPI003974EF4C
MQLCYLRFPGVITSMNYRSRPCLVADQLKVGVESWNEYGQREQARAPERAANRVRFPALHHEPLPAGRHADRAMQTDKGIVLASALIGHLRRQSDSARPQRRRAGECRGDHPC